MNLWKGTTLSLTLLNILLTMFDIINYVFELKTFNFELKADVSVVKDIIIKRQTQGKN